jgi:hypothetical protein
MRPPVAPPAGLPAVPTVVEPVGAPPALDVDPEELPVPAELVPGMLDALAALPAPVEAELDWERYIGLEGRLFGMHSLGASGKSADGLQ